MENCYNTDEFHMVGGPMSVIEEMRLFLEPRSVAMVGASRSTLEDSFFNSLECLLEYGFPGPIYPINPSTQEILGLKAYPSVAHAPDGIDLAVITLPRQAVLPAVRECTEKGIRAIIVMTQGFADADAEGKALQEEMVRLAREAGARILGPNTMGVVNARSRFSSAFVVLTKPERKLPVGFVGQSGFAIYLGLMTCPLGLPWIGAKGIDLGNTCDVDHADVLEYLTDDSQTKVIALHLEGVKNGRRFLQAVSRAAAIKPVLALKTGATESGARAAASHTGSLVGQDQVYDALLRQAGAIRVGDLEELGDLAKAFCVLPPLQGRRVAVLTPVGGLAVISADACGQFGLDLASYSPATLERLEPLFPSWMPIGNPLDVWPAAFTKPYNQVFLQVAEIVLEDPNVDGMMAVIWSAEGRYSFFGPCAELRDLAARYQKPIVAFLYGPQCQEGAAMAEEGDRVAAYPSPTRAIRALGALWKHQVYRRRLAARIA